MRFYEADRLLKEISEKEARDGRTNLVALFTSADRGTPSNCLPQGMDLTQLPPFEQARFCKIESYPQHLRGTFSIPQRRGSGEIRGQGGEEREAGRILISFCMKQNCIYFMDDSGLAEGYLHRIAEARNWSQGSIGQFFYDFLELLVEGDIEYLEDLEDRIAEIEDRVLDGNLEEFHQEMLTYRKELFSCFRYYDQMVDLGQKLQENENGFFDSEILSRLKLFTERTTRLQNETEILREYFMQVRELYLEQINMGQNKIMKILTIVTTIFLPLSLIAGWYGMNFVGMPELTWRYGYLAVILASVAVVLASVWICRKKNFW